MKKQYEAPKLEIEVLSVTDVLTGSKDGAGSRDNQENWGAWE